MSRGGARAARARVVSRPRAPWDFSEDPAPGEGAPNLPTAEGRRLGVELARLCDLEEARVRARFPRAGRRCDECALRAGTVPNGCPETLMDVVKCLVESVPFYCHKRGVEDGAPRRLCAGFGILAELGPELPTGRGFALAGPKTRSAA